MNIINNVPLDFTNLQSMTIYNYVHQDVKLYSELVINVRAPFSGTISLNWYSEPDTSGGLLRTDDFNLELAYLHDSIKKYFTVRAQWFGLTINCAAVNVLDGTLVTHEFRKSSSSVQLSDQHNQRAAINLGQMYHSIHSAIYDNSGFIVSDVCNNALFVNPSNIIDDNGCLSVGLFDGDNHKISSTDVNNSLLTTFVNSAGVAQASTISNALFYNLTDAFGKLISSIQTVDETNALHLSLDNSATAPLYVNYINKSANNNTEFLFSALVDNSLKQITLPDDGNKNQLKGFSLREIGIANETDQTVWLKIYDVSIIGSATVNDIKFNIPIPALETREITMGCGAYFINGVSLKLSNNYDYNAEGSALDTVFVTGSCIVLK